MSAKRMEKEGRVYVLWDSPEERIGLERDAGDLISACWEQDTRLLMLHADAMSDDFFRLRTGLAGGVLQKLVNYRIKTAAVVPDVDAIRGKAREMMAESNQGRDFRVFTAVQEAEEWLLA